MPSLAASGILGMVFGPAPLPSSPWVVEGLSALEWLLVLYTLYVIVIPLGGFRRLRSRRLSTPRSRFAIVVPAHNEQRVIGHMVDSCHALDYPRSLFDVYVVADNCHDDTAVVARAHDALVFERHDPARRGKGHALEYGFQRILSGGRHYDAVIVVDADNIIAPDFLRVMNTELLAGQRIIQGRMDVKNPEDTWITATFAMSVWTSNRFWYLAKYNLGLSAVLGGTGMCIATDVLQEIGWGVTSLTEDLEFTMKALTRGIKTAWAHDAIVYDEKPLTFSQSWYQRLRWVRGQVDVAARYMPRLLWSGIRYGDVSCLEGALQLFQPFYMVLASVLMVAGLAGGYRLLAYTFLGDMLFSPSWQGVWIGQYLLSLALPVFALMMDGGSRRTLRHFLLYPVFQYSWIALAWLGLCTYRNHEWLHTLHTRAIAAGELLPTRSAS